MAASFFVRSVFCALLVVSASFAEQQGARQYGPWSWGIRALALHQFDTDLAEQQGGFSVSRLFVQPSVGYAWDRRNSVSLSLGVGSSDYDFSSGTAIGGNAPWERIDELRFSVPMRFSPSDRTDAIVIPSVRSYAEQGANWGDGRTEGLLAGVGWKVSDTLTIGPGFGWYTELGGGSTAFPIVVLDWALTDKLSLTTGRGLAASRGPGMELNFALDKKWQLALIARKETTRFALDNNDAVSSASSNAFGQDESLRLLASVQYSPWPMATVNAFVGSAFDGELSLEDSSGRTVARSEYDVAMSLGLAFRARF